MGKWEMVRLGDVVVETITGEWGTECADGEKGTKILRTTNFTNLGVVSYENVVVRNIPMSKIERKKLSRFDIILEKSGGSDNQPVGRVVFFDDNTDEVYLCNNFTQILRVNQRIAFPKYVFLYLFHLHKNGTTELLQNKTTGIRNLQVRRYMSLDIPLPPLPVQRQIADVLDRAGALIEKRKAQIDRLELLVESQFNEMFGDPVTNPKGWEYTTLGSIAEITSSKRIFESEYVSMGIPFYRTKEIVELSRRREISTELFISQERYNEIKMDYDVPKIGDMLVSAVGTIGVIWVVDTDEPFYFKDGNLLWVKCGEACSPIFMKYLLTKRIEYYKKEITAGSAYNALTIFKLKEMKTHNPPLALQTQFADFVGRAEAQKSLLKKSLVKLELSCKSLMQKCFRGEIF